MSLLDASSPPHGTEPWWRLSDALPRFLRDLITHTAARLRPGAPLAPPRQEWSADTMLNEAGLGLDSLERLALASAVSAALGMDESGLGDYLLTDARFAHWCSVAAESLDRYSERITFHTSGSTGVPKSCSHTLADLEQEVEALVGLGLTGATRLLSAVPSHHIYGFLLTVLLPGRLGDIPVVDIRGHAPGAVLALARPGDVVVGHPAYWSAVARAGFRVWRPGVVGVTSTAPCPPDVADALGTAGLGRLIEIHGSSETAGIGWRDDPMAPYTLLPYWSRRQPDRLSRPEPAGTARVVESPDRLEWVGDRRYVVHGRRDSAVQVGGINVFPDRVRQVLCDHPLVEDAAIRLMHPCEGERLKAFVVLRPTSLHEIDCRRSITDFVEARLAVPERPRAVTFGEALPKNGLGKAADWSITTAAEPVGIADRELG